MQVENAAVVVDNQLTGWKNMLVHSVSVSCLGFAAAEGHGYGRFGHRLALDLYLAKLVLILGYVVLQGIEQSFGMFGCENDA